MDIRVEYMIWLMYGSRILQKKSLMSNWIKMETSWISDVLSTFCYLFQTDLGNYTSSIEL